MESRDSSKRKKDKQGEDAHYCDRKSKRPRSKSRTPVRYYDTGSRPRQKRSYSRSPERSVKKEKENERPRDGEPKKDIPERKPKETDMLNTRTGGAYIPPARLRMMQAQITDKSSVAYQRLAWEALKKSIHGHINKINVGNIGIIIKELLKENIVRGRGLLCRSVIQAQAASPTFTNVYAALVAAVNSRFPNIGELLLKRLVIQFKRGFKRNDKPTCISSASFIAHLVNQRVAHEILALELLTLLVETPTDDSVEVAIAFLKECGQKLTEVSSKGVNAIFEMLRNILHEGQLDKRVQYMIEVMFQVWKDGFKDHPALIEELELVPEEEQFTHLLMLDDATDPQDILNVFKFDEKYEENEQKYKSLSKEILGSDAESGEEDGSDGSGSEESEEEEGEEQKPVTIIDNTETNLVALRRTIYLTINSSLDFEECAHKLMKMQLKPGQEVELCHMFLDCCAEQRTYEKFYGLLAQRFCNINRIYISPFEEIFKDSYGTAHRLDTNRLRNVSKFFAHLLFTDSISWEVLECVKLNEEDTTSSSRIYIKILFQELAEYMGLKKLNDRLKDPTLQDAFFGIFPRDNPKNTRFSINFFTSIGLGGLTDELREHLKQMPKNVPAPVQEINLDSGSSSSSSSSSSEDSSDSSEDADAENKKKKKDNKDKSKEKTPKTAEPAAGDKNKNNDRWGHDGFYDTYGKDARRTENQNRDRDNFVRPQDVTHRDGRDKNTQRDNDFENRDNGDRRKRDDRNGRDSREDSRNRRVDRYDGRQNQEDNRRDYQSRNRDEDYNNTRHENENNDGGGHRRDDRYQRNSDRDESRNRRKDHREAEEKFRENSNKDNRMMEKRRNSAEEGERRKDKSSRDERRTERRKSVDEDERPKTNSNREDKRLERRRNSVEEDKRSRDKSYKEDRRRERRTYDEEDTTKGNSNKQDRQMDKRNYDGEERSRDRSDKERREKQRNNYDDDDRTSRYISKNKEKREDRYENEKKDKYRNEKIENTSDLRSSKNKQYEQDSSEDEDSRKKKKIMPVAETKSDDSDDEDKRHKKKKSKKSKDKKKNKKKVDDDGWDIRTGDSIRREFGERYWCK